MPKKRGRPCSICINKKRCQIDQCVLSGDSYRHIASQFKIGYKSLERHVDAGHVSKILESAAIENDAQIGLNIQKCAQEIYDLCFEAAQKAKKKDLKAVGSCIGPAVKVLEILNKGNTDFEGKSGLVEIRESMRPNASDTDVEGTSGRQ